jgi:hypothetical protein
MTDIEEKVAQILWKDKWKDIPYTTKGYDLQTGWEWDRERNHLHYVAKQLIPLIQADLEAKIEAKYRAITTPPSEVVSADLKEWEG